MVATRRSAGSAASAPVAPANGLVKDTGKGKAKAGVDSESVSTKRARISEGGRASDKKAASNVTSKEKISKASNENTAQAKKAKAPHVDAQKSEARASDDEYSNSEEEDASDDDAVLAGFSDVSGSDEEDIDSSDEDDEEGKSSKRGVISASGVVKLPSSKDDAVVRSRLEKVNRKRKERGDESMPIVLYFGRVPKSMPEDALRAYLSQFGDIQRLRLARNKKTGATKHYAFVEFADEDVGKIVCETMNNYLLEGRLLQVHIVPKEKIHPSLWIGANRKFRTVPGDRRHRVLHDERPRTDEQKAVVERKLLARQEQRREKIKAQGIEYDFDGYA